MTADRDRRHQARLGREHRAGTRRAPTRSTRPRSPAPKERLLVSTVRTGDVDGTLTGGWIGGLVGSGDRIAVNRWTTNESGEVATGTLQRVGARLATVSSGTTALHAQTLDLHRVAVLRADGQVAVYDVDSGGLFVTLKPSSARQVVIRKHNVLVLTRTRTIEVFDSRTGAKRAHLARRRRRGAARRALRRRGLRRRAGTSTPCACRDGSRRRRRDRAAGGRRPRGRAGRGSSTPTTRSRGSGTPVISPSCRSRR